MKYGLAFLPTVGRLDGFLPAFYRSMKKVQLTQVSRIDMTFDPFSGKRAESLRMFAFNVDTAKIRQTNFKCSVKLSVACDRTEPNMKITFNNGEKVLFKTENLTAKEIVDEFNILCEIHEKRAAEEENKKKKR